MGRLVEIAVSGIVLFLVLKLNKSFNFFGALAHSALALAADMLCQAAFPQVTLLRCVESSVWDLVVFVHVAFSGPILRGTRRCPRRLCSA